MHFSDFTATTSQQYLQMQANGTLSRWSRPTMKRRWRKMQEILRVERIKINRTDIELLPFSACNCFVSCRAGGALLRMGFVQLRDILLRVICVEVIQYSHLNFSQ